jgi:hypothetical protein
MISQFIQENSGLREMVLTLMDLIQVDSLVGLKMGLLMMALLELLE